MAKKTKLAEEKTEDDNLIFNSIIKEYGNILKSYSDVADEDKKIIPFSPALNFALGGGVAEGDLMLLAGKPKSGKSTSALQFAANAQSVGKHIFFANIECRLGARNLKGIHNLKPEKFTIIDSNRDKILTAEENLSIIENLAQTQPDSVIIIDSLSSLCPLAEKTEKITSQFRASGPRLLSAFLKRIRPVLSVNKIIMIGTLHLITNSGGGPGPAFLADGGLKVRYYSDICLEIKYTEPWLSNTGDQIGQKIHWHCPWSSLSVPGRKVTSFLRYGHGLDNEMELIEFGEQLGLISKAGSWFSYNDIKCQGQEKLRTALLENPIQLELLGKQVKEMLV